MARVNKTRYSVLGCLSIKDMSAYDIKSFMARSTYYFWQEHEAQLYPMLKKLTDEGLVGYKEEKAQKIGLRKMYHVTDQGISVLREWLASKTVQAPYRNEFLLKLFFNNQIDKTITIRRLESYKEDLQEDLAIISNILTNIPAKLAQDKRQPYRVITINYGVNLLQAEIQWCDESVKILQEVK